MEDFDLKRKVDTVLLDYKLDIAKLLNIPCKQAYIVMGEYNSNNSIRVYGNSYMSAEKFREFLYERIPKIEKQLSEGYLSIDTQAVVIEFDDGRYLTFSSSEWLSVFFDKNEKKNRSKWDE